MTLRRSQDAVAEVAADDTAVLNLTAVGDDPDPDADTTAAAAGAAAGAAGAAAPAALEAAGGAGLSGDFLDRPFVPRVGDAGDPAFEVPYPPYLGFYLAHT
jgi:hypothetical protein